MGSDETEIEESKRARVRRLLVEPLEVIGFRKPSRIDVETFRSKQDRMLDALAYMSDDNLATLAAMMRTKGQGKDRNIWPELSTFYGYAEQIQPSPVQHDPAMLRWFRSVEGPRAMQAGTLVETWAYFRRHKRPPVNAARELQERANKNHSRCQIIRERQQRGTAGADDVEWLRRYEERLDWCRRIVMGGKGGAE